MPATAKAFAMIRELAAAGWFLTLTDEGHEWKAVYQDPIGRCIGVTGDSADTAIAKAYDAVKGV